MFIDYQYCPGIGIDGLTVTADFPFASRPLPPSELVETIYITGSNQNDSGMLGTVDTDEQG